MDPGHVVCSGNWKKTRRGVIKVKLERERREQVTQNMQDLENSESNGRPLRDFAQRHIVLGNHCFQSHIGLRHVYITLAIIWTLFYMKQHHGAPPPHRHTLMTHSPEDSGLSTGPSLIGQRDKPSGKIREPGESVTGLQQPWGTAETFRTPVMVYLKWNIKIDIKYWCCMRHSFLFGCFGLYTLILSWNSELSWKRKNSEKFKYYLPRSGLSLQLLKVHIFL